MDRTLKEFIGSQQQPIGSGDMAVTIGGLIVHSVKHTHFSIGVSHLG